MNHQCSHNFMLCPDHAAPEEAWATDPVPRRGQLQLLAVLEEDLLQERPETKIPLAKKRDSGFTLIGCIGKPLHNLGYF